MFSKAFSSSYPYIVLYFDQPRIGKDQDFSTLALLTFGEGWVFVVGAVLCIEGCLAASPASTH